MKRSRFNYVVYVEVAPVEPRVIKVLNKFARKKSIGTTYHGGKTNFIHDATMKRLYWGFSTKERAEKLRNKFRDAGYVTKMISGKRAPCRAYGIMPLYLPKRCASATGTKGRWTN